MTAPRENAELVARDTAQVVPGRRGMKQCSFHDFSGVGIIMIGMIIGAVTGAAIGYLVPWLWSFIKPLIHALTA